MCDRSLVFSSFIICMRLRINAGCLLAFTIVIVESTAASSSSTASLNSFCASALKSLSTSKQQVMCCLLFISTVASGAGVDCWVVSVEEVI